jgi:uncharacterized membrane protein
MYCSFASANHHDESKSSRRKRENEGNDYLINLKSELELRSLHQKK